MAWRQNERRLALSQSRLYHDVDRSEIEPLSSGECQTMQQAYLCAGRREVRAFRSSFPVGTGWVLALNWQVVLPLAPMRRIFSLL